MPSVSGSVWAIDIGNNSLKALRLSNAAGRVEVTGFDNIQHGKILSGSGLQPAERDELIALSLRQFVSENNPGKDDIIISVPSQNSFARFVKLPPVDQKRIPEIVKFEAAQQIPFDINDVQWDWQLMSEGDGSEFKVGIFAIQNNVVTSMLEHFSRENMAVVYVQMAPIALYNYILYDRPELCRSDSEAVVVLNIGADNTDLVICTKSSVWQRCVPMGGNSFTKAISDTFKLNFRKAEKLKRTAPMSKYARQIFQSMRPVFTDLSSEIQRSLGFYSNSNPGVKLSRVIAFGGGTKMRGLLKYLQQSLQIPIERPDSFKNLAMGSDVSAAKFHESVNDFGVVYGLALQGLGLGKIESNLLPRSVARSMAWAGKAKYFVAASLMVFLVAILSFARTTLDRMNYAKHKPQRQAVSSIINTVRQANNRVETQQSRQLQSEALIQKAFKPFDYRDVIALLHQSIISALPNEKNNPEQASLYRAFASSDVDEVKKVPRKKRKQIFITSMSVRFSDDIVSADFSGIETSAGGRKKRGRGILYEEDWEDADWEDMQTAPQRSRGRKTSSATRKRRDIEGEEGIEAEGGAGFTVTIAGYSPYKNIRELMDPVGTKDDKTKWGFITRLMHLDEIADGNSPFELFGKGDVKHFKLEDDPVDLISRMTPVGTGIEEFRFAKLKGKSSEKYYAARRQEVVLIDPMTKEIISKVTELNDDGSEKLDPKSGEVIYEENDHWFILNVKFVWKDAPTSDLEEGQEEGQ